MYYLFTQKIGNLRVERFVQGLLLQNKAHFLDPEREIRICSCE